MMKILRNAIECLKCHTLAVSTHVHDFRYCECKAVAADGGHEYLRRVFDNRQSYRDANAFDATTAEKPSDLDGKFLVYSPTGKTNATVAFDRQEDAEESCKLMAQRTGQKLWFTAELYPAKP